jgi:DNA repair exonuclease SbcCD nuclease subunit
LFRFLHAADIHLDSPLRGLARYDDAPVDEIRAAPRRALENLVQCAIDEEVAFVLIVGDLYDGDWKDYNTGLFFIRQMRRLEEAGIGVHLIAGNHDAASQITKQLALPSNVTFYSNSKPQTVELAELGVAIHGQGFKTRSVTRDLAADYPVGEAGRFDIGLLHTSLDGRPGHDDYAPTSVSELMAKGYDYWALGHVHQREEVSKDPWIVFPGNLQGRHARETGPKGATLVTVTAGEVVNVEHRSFDVVRWARVEVDISEAARAEETLEMVCEAVEREIEGGADDSPVPLLALRVILTGRSDAHAELVREPDRWTHELREQLSRLGGDGVFLEKVRFDSRRRIDVESELNREDAMGDLLRLVASLEADSIELHEFVDPFKDVWKKISVEQVSIDEGFDPTDPECLRVLLPSVRELLLARLLEAGEDGA